MYPFHQSIETTHDSRRIHPGERKMSPVDPQTVKSGGGKSDTGYDEPHTSLSPLFIIINRPLAEQAIMFH
jgi:hypothetical protein